MHDDVTPGDHVTSRTKNLRRLSLTLALIAAYTVAEAVGGLLTNSLALLADAGHMLSDAASLALALFALWIAQRPRSPEKTFGYHRTEILAALANAMTLIGVSVFIVVEAWDRFRSPEQVDGRTMMWIAVGGLFINLAAMWILRAGRSESLNVKGAWLHVVADTLGSAQAIVAGALIWVFGWYVVDPVASVLIAALIVWSAWTLLRQSVNVLMEATPDHIDTDEVAAALTAVDSVLDVHDLHVWTITSGFESLTVHVTVEGRPHGEVLHEIRNLIRRRFGIEHSTVQVERPDDCAGGSCE
jgi:cobalt-zinc-cadmium efflux system protein